MKKLLVFGLLLSLTQGCKTSSEDNTPPDTVPDVVSTPAPIPVGDGKWLAPVPMTPYQIMGDEDGGYIKQLKVDTKVVTVECVEDADEMLELEEQIKALKAKGVYVICYHSLSYEDWREDIGGFPKAAKGKKMSGWSGEYWPDLRNEDAHKFWDKRYSEFKRIGADGVEDDNMDDGEDAWDLTHANLVASAKRRADFAHSIGLGHFSKNTPMIAKQLAQISDGVYIEEAGEYNEREDYNPWRDAKKFGAMIEYSKGNCEPYSGFGVQYHSGSEYFKGAYTACK